MRRFPVIVAVVLIVAATGFAVEFFLTGSSRSTVDELKARLATSDALPAGWYADGKPKVLVESIVPSGERCITPPQKLFGGTVVDQDYALRGSNEQMSIMLGKAPFANASSIAAIKAQLHEHPVRCNFPRRTDAGFTLPVLRWGYGWVGNTPPKPINTPKLNVSGDVQQNTVNRDGSLMTNYTIFRDGIFALVTITGAPTVAAAAEPAESVTKKL